MVNIKKFMKKIPLLFFLCMLTLINIKPYFHAGVPATHDGDGHLARFANYKTALKQLQMPPRFAPDLVNHYGYPVFNYNYPLPNIVSIPFTLFGFHYTTTYKILFSLMVFSGLMGLWKLLSFYKLPKKSQYFSLTVYAVSPFLSNLIYVRGNTGEIMAWGLLPWLFVVIEQIKHLHPSQPLKYWKTSFPYIAVAVYSAFFLAHNVTVLFTIPLILTYSLFVLGKDFQKWKILGIIVITSVCSTLWFWLPAMMEKSLIILDTVSTQHDFVQHFPTLSQLLSSPLQFGYSYPGSTDSLSFQIGFTQWFVLAVGVVFFLKGLTSFLQKNEALNKTFLFIIIAAVALTVFQLPQTKWLWTHLPLVNYIQFPWRLSIFSSFFIAILGGYIFAALPKSLKLLSLTLLLIQVVILLNLSALFYLNKSDLEYELYSQSTSTSHENTPKTFTYLGFSDWAPHPFILSGIAEYQVQHWTGSDKKYVLQVQEDALIAEPTMNFAGWQTTANNQKVEYLNNDQVQGRIAFRLPPGEYQIHSQFTQWTWPRIVGNTISLLTVIGLGSWGIGQWWLSKRKV